MFIVCSDAEICSIVVGIKYCLIDTDPCLEYAEHVVKALLAFLKALSCTSVLKKSLCELIKG